MSKKMSLDEYLGKMGLAFPVNDFGIDKQKIPRGLTQRQKKKLDKQTLEASEDYHSKRNNAIKEYYRKVENGEIIEPTEAERLIKKTQGHPDNESVQAAKRVLAKRSQKFVDNIKNYYTNGNLEKAYECWCKLYDLYEPINEMTTEEKMEQLRQLTSYTNQIEDKIVFDITDYSREKTYREMGYYDDIVEDKEDIEI